MFLLPEFVRTYVCTLVLTFFVSGSINQFHAPVAVQTDTTIKITETEKDTLDININVTGTQVIHLHQFSPFTALVDK